MRKLRNGVLVLMSIAALATLGAAPAAAASGFQYTFSSTAEGWETAQGTGGGNVTATWAPSAGNPGGAISVTDSAPSGYDGFISPLGLAGDYGANFGGTLSFDIKSTQTWSEEAGAALFGSANHEEVLCLFDESVTPGAAYQTAHFTLDGAHTFRLDSEGNCATHPTDAEVSEVLSTLQAVVINGEDVEASNETTTLDNITLSGGAPLAKNKLTLLKAGTGSGSVSSSPAGIICGTTCSAEFLKGTTVTLSATPASGSTFTGWSGGGCTGTATCQVTLSADREVTAIFEKVPAAGGGSTLPPTPKPRLKCKKGFKRKTVHGKARCVKIKKKKHRHAH